MDWESFKKESELLIKSDGYVAIEEDEWKWIVAKIEKKEEERDPIKDIEKWVRVCVDGEREKKIKEMQKTKKTFAEAWEENQDHKVTDKINKDVEIEMIRRGLLKGEKE